MSMPRSQNRKPGCKPCRERHLRCDRVQPVCSSCRRAKQRLDCDYTPQPLKLRPSIYCSTGHRSGSGNTEASKRSPQAATRKSQSNSPQANCDVEPTTATSRDYAPGTWSNGDPVDLTFQDQSALKDTDISSHSGSPEAVRLLDASFRPSDTGSPDLAWRRRIVTDSLDAKLFDFYVQHAGPWLDIVSPGRYFGEVVPRLALKDSALYYACLAYSARVLTLMGEIEETKGTMYEDQAISELIPRLSDTPGISEHKTIPATSVILRMAEQFTEFPDDMRCHLIGASSIFASHPDSSSLGAAAFWLYLRQSIRMSILNEEPCKFEAAGMVQVDFSPSSDEAWANRMTYLLGRTCSACWDLGLLPPLRVKLLEQLQMLLELWAQSVPDTFQPWCRYRAANDSFPIIRYVCPWHVVGWQYYYMAKLLIGMYKKPGSVSMLDMSRHMEAEVLGPARLLCAITFACSSPGLRINGTALVFFAGKIFSDEEEQSRLLDFLVDCMNKEKWPNRTCCDRLRRIWSGEADSGFRVSVC